MRRKTRTLFWSGDGEGEISFRGYWKEILERPESFCGRSWTVRWPSPGAEEDGGKGEVMKACY